MRTAPASTLSGAAPAARPPAARREGTGPACCGEESCRHTRERTRETRRRKPRPRSSAPAARATRGPRFPRQPRQTARSLANKDTRACLAGTRARLRVRDAPVQLGHELRVVLVQPLLLDHALPGAGDDDEARRVRRPQFGDETLPLHATRLKRQSHLGYLTQQETSRAPSDTPVQRLPGQPELMRRRESPRPICVIELAGCAHARLSCPMGAEGPHLGTI